MKREDFGEDVLREKEDVVWECRIGEILKEGELVVLKKIYDGDKQDYSLSNLRTNRIKNVVACGDDEPI